MIQHHERTIYTLKKDSFDPNDINITINLKLNHASSEIHLVDHRALCPAVYKQYELGSCTANALSCIFYHNLIRYRGRQVFDPSRLFLYYNTRLLKNMVEVDDGGSLREALKALNIYGMCPEDMWPYETRLFSNRPPYRAYKFGRKHKSITYFRVPQELSQLKQCLIDGYLFAFGMCVHQTFESESVRETGIIPMPQASDRILGGHAVCAVGFDDQKEVFIVRNSWGEQWGDHGYCFLPYEYMINADLVYDLWTFRNGPDEIIPNEFDLGPRTQIIINTTINKCDLL